MPEKKHSHFPLYPDDHSHQLSTSPLHTHIQWADFTQLSFKPNKNKRLILIWMKEVNHAYGKKASSVSFQI